jgi:hypothetical protein
MDLADLPEGPVTIVFTDIEGSTALRTTLGDAETDALFREHDELVREQIEEITNSYRGLPDSFDCRPRSLFCAAPGRARQPGRGNLARRSLRSSHPAKMTGVTAGAAIGEMLDNEWTCSHRVL